MDCRLERFEHGIEAQLLNRIGYAVLKNTMLMCLERETQRWRTVNLPKRKMICDQGAAPNPSIMRGIEPGGVMPNRAWDRSGSIEFVYKIEVEGQTCRAIRNSHTETGVHSLSRSVHAVH